MVRQGIAVTFALSALVLFLPAAYSSSDSVNYFYVNGGKLITATASSVRVQLWTAHGINHCCKGIRMGSE